MTRNAFVSLLRERLSTLPPEDIQKTVNYYNEMISDRMEDGMSEEAIHITYA